MPHHLDDVGHQTTGTAVASRPRREDSITKAMIELFATPRIRAERRSDGSVLLSSEAALGPYARSMAHLVRGGAERHPDRVLAAERNGDAWSTLTWGEARLAADAIAQALLDQRLGASPAAARAVGQLDRAPADDSRRVHRGRAGAARSASPTR